MVYNVNNDTAQEKKVEFGENLELQLKIREIYVLYTASCILKKSGDIIQFCGQILRETDLLTSNCHK